MSKRSFFLALFASLLVAALFADPAGAVRLRSPSSSLTLAQPTVTCGASPSVNLAWSDTTPSASGHYYVMSKPASAKSNTWVQGITALAGTARSTSVPEANNQSLTFAIRSVTSTTRDSNVVTVSVNCAPGDTTPPPVPTTTGTSTPTCKSATVAWNAVTDTGGSGLAGYILWRGGVQLNTTPMTTLSYTDSALAPSTLYSYQASAIDKANNQSAKSTVVNVTTPACPPPVANAGPDQTHQTLVAVAFDGSGSTDAFGTITSYAWNFGDGATNSGVAPSHTYLHADSYTVTLTVTDNWGHSASDTAVVTATDRPPVANAGPDMTATVGTAVTFNGSGSSDLDGTITSYAWNFGDTSTGTGVSPSHTYPTTGMYSATLVVTDNNGVASTPDLVVINVGAAANKPPVANAGSSQSAQTLVSVTFNGSGSSDPDGSIVSYAWTFGDGSTGTGVSPSHTYAHAGLYAVTLTVTDNGGATASASTTASIINRAPTAVLSAAPTSLQVGQTVTFNGGASSDPDGHVVTYSFGFGDGGGATTASTTTTHTYTTAGVFVASLTVQDDSGSWSNVYQVAIDVVAAPQPPTANAGLDQTATVGAVVSFNGIGSSDPHLSVASWNWTFGDGASASGVNVTHAYTAAGTYTATLTVTDTLGQTASDSAIITITNATVSTWAHQISGLGSQTVYAIKTDSAGNVYAAGTFNNTTAWGTTSLTSAGLTDGFIAKYSPSGAVLWVRPFGGTNGESVNDIVLDHAGNIDVTGGFAGSANFGGATPLVSVNSGSSPSTDIYVAQYTQATGAYVWAHGYGSANTDSGYGVGVDAANNVFVGGFYSGAITFGSQNLKPPFDSDLDAFVLKLNSAGSQLWVKNFTNNGNDQTRKLVVDGSGNVAIEGNFSNTINFGGADLTVGNALSNAFVAEFDNNGGYLWSRKIGDNNGNVDARGLAVDSAGNVIATGSTLKALDYGGGVIPDSTGTDIWVAKYSSTGAYSWAKDIGGTGNDYSQAVSVDAANNVLLAGYFESTTIAFGGQTLNQIGSGDGYITKISSGGSFTWARQFGGTSADQLDAVAAEPDGSVVAGGYFYGTATYDGTTLTSADGTSGVDGVVLRTSS
jgi:PKD repeat protein